VSIVSDAALNIVDHGLGLVGDVGNGRGQVAYKVEVGDLQQFEPKQPISAIKGMPHCSQPSTSQAWIS